MKTLIFDRPMAPYEPMRKVYARMPDRSDVENLKVGDLAPDCFGRMARVTKIFGNGTDINGKRFVCYMCAMSDRDTIENGCGCSASMKDGKLIRTVALTGIFTSAECDNLEEEMRKE